MEGEQPIARPRSSEAASIEPHFVGGPNQGGEPVLIVVGEARRVGHWLRASQSLPPLIASNDISFSPSAPPPRPSGALVQVSPFAAKWHVLNSAEGMLKNCLHGWWRQGSGDWPPYQLLAPSLSSHSFTSGSFSQGSHQAMPQIVTLITGHCGRSVCLVLSVLCCYRLANS